MGASQVSRAGRSLAAWCRSLVEEGRVSAVSARVSGRALGELSAGAGPEGALEAHYDLASLTKPFTATLALALDDDGELPLATRLGEIWPRADARMRPIPLEALLRHESGLRRWVPLYATCSGEEEVLARLLSGEWLRDDSGPLYSDLGYILWSLAAERATERAYWRLLRSRVLEPLGLDRVAATGETLPPTAVCRLGTGREVELAAEEGLEIDDLGAPAPGQPQDGNSRFLGRPLGHAGLFATASTLLALGREWLEGGRVLSERARRRSLEGLGRFAIGWYRAGETAALGRLGPAAFGHDGFTGGSVWIEPAGETVGVVLCHRSRLDVDLSGAREKLVEDLQAR